MSRFEPIPRKHSNLTTIGGLLTALGAAILAAERTVGLILPEWAIVVGLFLTAAGPVLLGTSARDHSVSSEEAGAK
jgi:multisubunit Na+/H+ antiporter MnhG subunit